MRKSAVEKPLLPMKSKIHNSGGDGNIVDVDFIEIYNCSGLRWLKAPVSPWQFLDGFVRFFE